MPTANRKSHLTRLGAAILGLLLGAPLFAAAQQQVAVANLQSAPAPAVQSAAPSATDAQDSQAQTLHLLVGRSLVITSPTRIKRISLADPTIAETVVINPNQLVVNGKAPGGVSLLVWDENGQSQAFDLLVDTDILGLSHKIKAMFPNEPVKIEAAKDVIMLSGRVSSNAVADKMVELAKSVNTKVSSFLQGPSSPAGQILLQVRFAEVDRTAISQWGVNLLSLPGAKNIGATTTQQFAPPQLVNSSGGSGVGAPLPGNTSTSLGASDLLNIFLFRPDINLAATIKALQDQQILQILAEPNLLTASGKEASFLAGGEFPIPILQTATGGAYGITIQFKEFGVRLNFTPTLLPDGLIHLKVQPEVSSLDFTNALTLQGFVIPALSTRRVMSEMDLGDGQSFAIAGLVDNRVIKHMEKVPGIGDIPIIGKLFQSQSVTKSRGELLVIVTPRIVHPADANAVAKGPAFPVPFLQPASTDKALQEKPAAATPTK